MTVQPPFALTQALATFAATTLELPAAALEVAAQGLTDAAGLIVKARHEAVVHAVLQVHAPAGTSGPCSLLLGPGSAGPLDAAMVNGTAAHAFALDDVAWGCHPSAMLLPALLAVGEMQDASGAELLRAWVVGYEVLAELASREPGSLHTTGWHPSGLLGPVAVAAAVAKLMRLDAASTLAALSNAASMSGGVSANFGTTMKAVHVGQVAAAGVRACLLARAGVAGSADVLERARGLLATLSPSGAPDLQSPLGTSAQAPRLLSAGLSLKRYPLCYSLHRIADAAIALAATPGLVPEQITQVRVELGVRQWQMAPHVQPADGVQARYSAPFAVASGLLAGAASFAQLEPAFYGSPGVRRLIALTEIVPCEGASPDDPVFSPADRVQLHLADGRVLDSGPVSHPRGHARHPLDAAQRRAKFLDCLAGSSVRDPQACHEMLSQWGQLSSVRELHLAFGA